MIDQICEIFPCVPHSEIVSIILRGAVTGGSAIGIYLLQKRMEAKSNRYDLADILHDEVGRIYSMRHDDPFYFKNTDKPTTTIYAGLIHTGNIRYFDGKLRKKLNKLYANFEVEPTRPNVKDCGSIIRRLEKIRRDNRNYRTRLKNLTT